mgnify:CR=1 FL=1
MLHQVLGASVICAHRNNLDRNISRDNSRNKKRGMRIPHFAFRVPNSALGLRLQLHIPVRFADELRPTRHWGMPGRIERLPLRPAGLGGQLHVGFLRRPISLPLIALDAGQHAVFPRAGAAARTRHDVVDRQRIKSWLRTAILAGLVVSLKQVAAE